MQQESNQRRRVIVLVKNGMGDVIMALPLLRDCAATLRPGDELIVLVKGATERDIVVNAIDAEMSVMCVGQAWKGSFWSVLQLARTLRKKRPTLLLLPHSTSRLPLSLFSWLVGAEVTIAPDSQANRVLFEGAVKLAPGTHKVHYYQRFASTAGISVAADTVPALTPGAQPIGEAKFLLGNWEPSQQWIGLAPGSGIHEQHKRWPPEHYIALATALLRRSERIQIAVIGGPDELELVNEIAAPLSWAGNRVAMIVQPNILVTSAVLSLMQAVVCGCSGSAHLASAVSTPVVGVFGPTNPGFTGPLGKSRIVRAGLRCSPCYRVGFTGGCEAPVCMSVSPGRVEQELLLALAGEFSSDDRWFPTTRATKADSSVS